MPLLIWQVSLIRNFKITVEIFPLERQNKSVRYRRARMLLAGLGELAGY